MNRALFALASLVIVACSSADPSLDGAPQTGSPGGTSNGDDAGGVNLGRASNDAGGDAHATSPGQGDDGGAPIATSDSGASSDGSSSSDGHAPTSSAIEFAPYFPTWAWGASGYAYTSLVDLQKKAGVNAVTIAFVLSNGGCDTTEDIEQNLTDLKAFQAAGGHVKASFGGADGAYVESKCGSAAALAKAFEDFVDATGITDLDFDVEQDPMETDAVNAMRGQALKTAQDARGIHVAFTLPANPSPNGGLTSEGKSVVSHAVSAGVTIDHVNFMTMDYGDSFGGKALAPVVEGSLRDGHDQIVQLVPGISSSDAWRVVGVIPMIGKNDDSEVFSLADAKDVAQFAATNHVGLVSFWSIDRDRVCPSGGDYNACSTVETSDFAFAKALGAAALP